MHRVYRNIFLTTFLKMRATLWASQLLVLTTTTAFLPPPPTLGTYRPCRKTNFKMMGSLASRAPEPGKLSVKVGGKALNVWGVLFGASMTAWVVALYPLVLSCAAVSFAFDRKKRRAMDFMVTWWAKLSMLFCGYRPEIIGQEHLPMKGEAVLFAPNHCSYLDILTLSGFLRRPFKYISKIEILRIPLIGWAMNFAGHVALRRADRRSQLETYKAAVSALKNGNSIVAFPEGTRSTDGILQPFKRGPFKMAKDAGVDVIPVAIYDLHKFHPTSALMPLARPKGVQIKILPRISSQNNDVNDILDSAWTSVNSALPPHQQSSVLDDGDDDSTSNAAIAD